MKREKGFFLASLRKPSHPNQNLATLKSIDKNNIIFHEID